MKMPWVYVINCFPRMPCNSQLSLLTSQYGRGRTKRCVGILGVCLRTQAAAQTAGLQLTCCDLQCQVQSSQHIAPPRSDSKSWINSPLHLTPSNHPDLGLGKLLSLPLLTLPQNINCDQRLTWEWTWGLQGIRFFLWNLTRWILISIRHSATQHKILYELFDSHTS